MPRFMYVFRGGGYAEPDSLSPTELQEHLAKWNAWSASLIARGRQVSAEPLAHPPSGKTVRGRDKMVTDGPYAESKDLVSGIVVVEAASLDEAAGWARDCPILELGGSVEVRPLLVPPGR